MLIKNELTQKYSANYMSTRATHYCLSRQSPPLLKGITILRKLGNACYLEKRSSRCYSVATSLHFYDVREARIVAT